MSMYKAIYNRNGERIEVQFTPIINIAKKHFLFNIMLRFDKEQKERLKELRKSDDIDITIENELEQNMYKAIAETTTLILNKEISKQ